MMEFETIENGRMANGYTTLQYKKYKNYCNKMKLINKDKNSTLHLLYSLESNLAKFKILNSLQYLYKNRRLLKKENSEFSKIYQKYNDSFIENSKGSADINVLVTLRNDLADYYSFLDDIYILADNRHDFEQYKVKTKWNDIPIVFETEKIHQSFISNRFFLNDFRFNTQLARKILLVENRKKDLESLVAETDDPFKTFGCSNDLLTAVCDLERFLDENFVESKFLKNLKSSCEQIHLFFKKLMEYHSGVLHSDIDGFKAPECFKSIEKFLEAMKKAKKIDQSKLRRILLEIVEKRLAVDCKSRKMPFLPVFYDIANDHINYETVDNSIAGILQSFNFFNKK